ncbi:hypothetical protein KSP40_PGU000678 [Platanthera guangdongensis]|uniref:HhH-GPD domain-containing protein n=1 Tax=Platanthera guangdongensis TaxID=2320717 RepID=A0ABR2M1R5_9ASPA
MSSYLPPVLALAAPVSGRRVNVSSKTKLASASSQSMDEQGNEGRDSAPNSCHTGIRSHNPLFSKKRKTSVDQMEREAVVSPVKLKRKRKGKKSKKNTKRLRTTRTAENLHTEENSSCCNCNADINKESLQKFENMLKQLTYNENKMPQDIPNYVKSQIGNADATFSSTKIESIEESKKMRKLQQHARCRGRRTMTKREKTKDCYRRIGADNTWASPNSPYGLLQEDHSFDPWRVLVICILLNQTTGTQVKKVLPHVFLICPTAEAAILVSNDELTRIISSLGLQNKRARDIREMSRQYLEDWWTHVTELHGVGKYAADAYAIFCVGKPEDVVPYDHMIVKYWKYVVQWKRDNNM